MNTSETFRIHTGLPISAPPTAAVFGNAAAWLFDGLRVLTRALAPTAHAPRFARDPGAADRACAEAAQVRRMAYEMSARDPGFAADLYAAADRHERLHGIE